MLHVALIKMHKTVKCDDKYVAGQLAAVCLCVILHSVE